MLEIVILICGVIAFIVGLIILLWPGLGWVQRGLGLACCCVTAHHAAFMIGLVVVFFIAIGFGKNRGGGAAWNQRSAHVYRRVFDVRIRGYRRYNVDRRTPVIFLVGHTYNEGPLDSFGLGLLDQPNVRIMASFPAWSPLGMILNLNNYVYVKPGGGAYANFIEQGSSALAAGDSLLSFPEGKNSKTQTSWRHLAPFQSGIFDLALSMGVPLVPVLFEGKRSMHGFFTPGVFRVHFLEPIYPLDFSSKEQLRDGTRAIMNAKLALL